MAAKGSLRETLKSSLHFAHECYSLAQLRERDARCGEAWAAAAPIPGWFQEIFAAAIFQVLAEVWSKRIVEIGSYLGKSTVFFARSLQVLGIEGRRDCNRPPLW